MRLLYQVLLVASLASGLYLALIGRLLYNRPGRGVWGEPPAVVGVPSSILGGALSGISLTLTVASFEKSQSVELLMLFGVTSVLTLLVAIVYVLLLRTRARTTEASARGSRRVLSGDYLPVWLASISAISGILALLVRAALPT